MLVFKNKTAEIRILPSEIATAPTDPSLRVPLCTLSVPLC